MMRRDGAILVDGRGAQGPGVRHRVRGPRGADPSRRQEAEAAPRAHGRARKVRPYSDCLSCRFVFRFQLFRKIECSCLCHISI